LSRRDAIIAGALALAAAALIPLDRGIDKAIRDTARPSFRRFKRQAVRMRPLQETVWFFAGLLLYGTGRLSGLARLADLGLHLSVAEVVGSVLGHPWKWLVGRTRPSAPIPDPKRFRPFYGFKDVYYRSFPSLHMVGNFAAASVITAEASRWRPRSTRVVAPVTYGGAAYLGLLRMYDGAHWASDVIVGAAIGIFSGTAVVRYAHTHPGNRVDRWLLGVAPGPDGREATPAARAEH
jgi:membrane-associated phospholipid phosphatase